MLISKRSLANSSIIFCCSLIFCIALLIMERVAGLHWDFHPDAMHYIDHSAEVSQNILSQKAWQRAVNNSYYLIVNLFEQNIFALITLNIIIYSLTNVIIFNVISSVHIYSKKSHLFYILLISIVFDPYRMHLGISILKDTIILFLITLLFLLPKTLKIIPLILMPYFRIILPSLALFYLSSRIIVILIFIFTTIIFVQFELIQDFLEMRNQGNMQLRSFDKIPNFFEFGVLGAILRMLTWPMLYLSGFFIILSPAPLFFPVFFQVITVFTFWCLFLPKDKTVFVLIGYLAAIALVVSGFTAYIRYAIPALYFALLMCSDKSKKLQKDRCHATF